MSGPGKPQFGGGMGMMQSDFAPSMSGPGAGQR